MNYSETVPSVRAHLLALTLSLPSLSAETFTVDFNEYSSGRVVNSEYATNGADNTNSPLPPGAGFRVAVDRSSLGPNATANANIYNTAPPIGQDDDLEYGAAGSANFVGGALIIQENTNPISIPDDAASGATLVFDFESPLVTFQALVVDLDNPEHELVFINTSTNRQVVIPLSQVFQAGQFEDGRLARTPVFRATDLGLGTFDRVLYNLSRTSSAPGNPAKRGSSGGLGDIRFMLEEADPENDFGDAPNSYRTTQASNGARHLISDNLKLGMSVDGEDDASPSANALSDGADEDGITFPDGLAIDRSSGTFVAKAVVMSSVPTGAGLMARDDFSSNTYSAGSGWSGPWREINDDGRSNRGTVRINWPNDRPNGVSNTGFPDGESSLILQTGHRGIYRQFDFSSAGADGNLMFAYRRDDLEINEQVVVSIRDARGNNTTLQTIRGTSNGGDTDSAYIPVSLTIPQEILNRGPAQLRIVSSGGGNPQYDYVAFREFKISVPTVGSEITLVGWIDLDRSGTFDRDEAQVLTSSTGLVADSATLNMLMWNNLANLIPSNVSGPTYARFRLTTDPDFANNPTPGGQLGDGEVEDYRLTINPSTASVGDFVFLDLNANGVQDANEQGLSNVLVQLLDTNGNVVSEQRTDGNGSYNFPDVAAGRYSVKITNPNTENLIVSNLGSPGVENNNQFAIISGMPTMGLTPEFDVEAGDEITNKDGAFLLPATLGNFAFVDANGNGQFDNGESPLNGVTVQLLDENGDVIATQTTGDVTFPDGTTPAGGYIFTGLPSGNYSVKMTAPQGSDYLVSRAGTTGANNNNQLPDLAQNMSTTASVNLAAGDSNLTLDGAFYLPAALGDVVFNDLNQNGIQDGGAETGVNNVTVSLIDENGDVVASQVTGQDGRDQGEYIFENLIPGDYQVRVSDLPAGFLFTAQNVGSDANDSDVNPTTGILTADVLLSGERDLTNDAGIFQPSSLGNQIFVDVDGDGVFTSGVDTPLAGVTVQLLDENGQPVAGVPTQETGPDGTYLFPNIAPGTYSVKLTTPVVNGASYQAASTVGAPNEDNLNKATDLDGMVNMSTTIPVFVGPGQANTNLDAGYFLPASLGDVVFNDLDQDGQQDGGDEVGVSGVTVTLLEDGDVVTSQTTGTNGAYLFENLEPGEYTVEFTNLPDGFQFTGQNVGDDSSDSDVDPATGILVADPLTSGETDLTNDAGIFQPAGLGNQIFVDVDGDGVFTIGTDLPLEGAVVQLLDGNGQPVADLPTQETGPDGTYLFPDLAPGTYSIKVTTPLANGESYSAATVVGSVDADNANKATDLPGMENMSTTTPVSLEAGETNLTLDAGYTLPAALGNVVFLDLNNDGQQAGPGEDGIAGVTVELLDGNGQPVLGDDGTPVTTQTDSDGTYQFVDLVPGAYQVRVIAPESAPRSSDVDDTADNQQDLDDNGVQESEGEPALSPVVILSSGETDNTIDFGFLNAAGLGDQVFFDENNNGVRDAGEAPIADVTVQLLDENGDPVDGVPTQSTDSNGGYFFPGLPAGTYIVKFTAPSGPEGQEYSVGSTGTIGSNDNSQITANGPSMGVTPVITLESGETVRTADAGFVLPAQLLAIGSTVFSDLDNNGTQDDGETGLDDVAVQLIDATTGDVLREVNTAGGGNYLFDGLNPGTYIVRVPTPPTGLPLSSTTTAADEVTDGDDNGNQTEEGAPTDSQIVTLALGEEPTNESAQGGDQDDENDSNGNMTIDFGFVDPETLGSLGNIVFFDTNNDGRRQSDEAGINGLTVELLVRGNPTPIATTTTENVDGQDGVYLFDNLPEGEYLVVVSPSPATPQASTVLVGGDDGNKGSQTALGEPSQSPPIGLGAGEDNFTIDFGFVPQFGLGNLVFIDNDEDGRFGAGDTRVSDVSLSLFDINDLENAIATTTTDSSGNYFFGGLAAGKYVVNVDASNFQDAAQPLVDATGPLNATVANTADTGLDDDDSQNGRVSSDPAAIGVFSDIIMLGAVGTEPVTTETGDLSDSDSANDANTDLTVDFGFRPLEVSPQGCFYIAGTGEIIPGGGINVIAPDGNTSDAGSSNVIVTADGSDGCFSWDPVGADGEYCVTYRIPAGYVIDPNFDFQDNGGTEFPNVSDDTPFDPTPAGPQADTPSVLVLGEADLDGDGFLDAADGSQGGNISDNPAYAKFLISGGDPAITNINIPLVKASSFNEWVAAQPEGFPTTGPDSGPLGNPDADGFSNLLEYALCLHPTTGLKTFPNGDGVNNGLRVEMIRPQGADTDENTVFNACYNRPNGAADLTYQLQVYNPEAVEWINADLAETTSAGEAGSTKVTIADLEQLTPGQEFTRGIVRLQVTLTTPDGPITEVTTPQGWQSFMVDPFCETLSKPFNKPCLFTGTVALPAGGDGFTIDFSLPVGDGDLTEILDFENQDYYVEITSGDREGELLHIDSATATTVTIKDDTDLYAGPIHSTHLGAMDTSFAGGLAIIRAFDRMIELVPFGPFNAGDSVESASNILLLDRNAQEIQTLFLNEADQQWYLEGTTTSFNDRLVPPYEGIFSHNRSLDILAPFELAQVGEVRTNQLNVPLKERQNLIASVYPVEQSPNSRLITIDNGFTGGNNLVFSDQIRNWAADDLDVDPNTGLFPETFVFNEIFLLNIPAFTRWIEAMDRRATDVSDMAFFEPRRAAVIYIHDESTASPGDDDMPDYLMPAQLPNERN